MRRIRNIALGALGGLCLTACATAPVADGAPDMNDPLERANRRVFELSLAIDKSVTRPAAVAYRDVVPVNVREMIRNFLNNLNSPSVFANDVLQGEVDRARVTLVRTVVNTGVGAGGIFAEALNDRTCRIAPFGREVAVEMLGELRCAAMLRGLRGNPAANFDAVADVLVRLSRFVWDYRDTVAEVDINPLIATPQAAIAADALIVGRHAG